MTNFEKVMSFLCFVMAIVLYVTRNEILEIKAILDVSNNALQLSEVPSYVKDFMDRNIEFYSIYTSALFGIGAIIAGFMVTYQFRAEVSKLEKLFVKFKMEQSNRNDNHKREFEKIKKENHLLVSTITSQGGALNGNNGHYHKAAFSYFKSLVNFLLAHKNENKETNMFNGFFSNTIRNLEIVIVNLDPIKKHKNFLEQEQIDVLLNESPKKFRNDIMKILISFNEKCS